jgi:hypothetical protein
MSQAEKPNTTKLSRRSALAGLSLFATASVATIAAGAELGDDAELLALAAQFEPLYAEWLELMTTQEEQRAKFEALLAPRMRAQLGEDGSYSTDEYRDARWSAIDELDRDGLGSQRLTDQSVCDLVKAYAERIGLKAVDFGAHSLRAGFLTSAARRGASVFKMRDVSRHKSMDVLQAYVRDADMFRDHAGAGLL